MASGLLAEVPESDRIRVEQRIATLSGGDLSAFFGGSAEPAIAEDDGEDELLDDMEGETDDLVDDFEDPVSAPETAPETAPESDPGLFGGIFEEGTIAEIDPGLVTPGEEGGIDEARSLVSLGLYAEAQEILVEVEGLAASALLARCRREGGDLAGAFSGLKRSLGDADDEGAGMDEALFEAADLASRVGKHRAALRYLGELSDIAPDFRTEEVEENIAFNKAALKG
jgi:hypothetical protein